MNANGRRFGGIYCRQYVKKAVGKAEIATGILRIHAPVIYRPSMDISWRACTDCGGCMGFLPGVFGVSARLN